MVYNYPKNAMSLVFVLIALSGGPYLFAQEHYAIGMIGGDGIETTFPQYYRNSRNFYKSMNSIGITGKKLNVYFGVLAGEENRVCLAMADSESLNSILKNDLKTYLNGSSKKRCDDAIPLLNNMVSMSTGHKNPIQYCLSDTVKHEYSYLSGAATSSNFFGGINGILQKVQPGDHVIIFLADHGNQFDLQSPMDWGISFGTEEEAALRSSELNKLIRKFSEKKVTVHLDVDACYSGGFLKEISAHSACGTSSADENTPSIIGNEYDYSSLFLKNRGSQLEAFFCAIATNSVGNPITTLDYEINKWEAKKDLNDCKICDNGSLQQNDLMRDTLPKGSIFSDEVEVMRGSLISAFQSIAAKTAENCEKANKNKFRGTAPDWEINYGDSRVYEEVKACAQKVITEADGYTSNNVVKEKLAKIFQIENQKNNASALPGGERAIENQKNNASALPGGERAIENQKNNASALPGGERANDVYWKKMVDRHLSFLKKAPAPALKAYKQNFCCLAYEMKTKKYPAVCL